MRIRISHYDNQDNIAAFIACILSADGKQITEVVNLNLTVADIEKLMGAEFTPDNYSIINGREFEVPDSGSFILHRPTLFVKGVDSFTPIKAIWE